MNIRDKQFLSFARNLQRSDVPTLDDYQAADQEGRKTIMATLNRIFCEGSKHPQWELAGRRWRKIRSQQQPSNPYLFDLMPDEEFKKAVRDASDDATIDHRRTWSA